MPLPDDLRHPVVLEAHDAGTEVVARPASSVEPAASLRRLRHQPVEFAFLRSTLDVDFLARFTVAHRNDSLAFQHYQETAVLRSGAIEPHLPQRLAENTEYIRGTVSGFDRPQSCFREPAGEFRVLAKRETDD